MKFVIGASNVKIFAKSVLALSKIGDELYIEPLQNSVSSNNESIWFSIKSWMNILFV